jgi:hypothetical protein
MSNGSQLDALVSRLRDAEATCASPELLTEIRRRIRVAANEEVQTREAMRRAEALAARAGFTRGGGRIMYIEDKSNGLSGPGRIGRVTFSKTGKSVYYAGRTFQSLKGQGFKANYFDAETGEEFWISGCKKRGGDRLYGGVIEIDEDVREEYWVSIRCMP